MYVCMLNIDDVYVWLLQGVKSECMLKAAVVIFGEAVWRPWLMPLAERSGDA